MLLLIDSNVILDFILEREPFFKLADKVISLSENENFTLCVSASAITDIYYIAYKNIRDREKVISDIKKILEFTKIVAVTEKEIKNALNLNWRDFEDAVQYSVALLNGIDGIVTRNITDYNNSEVKIFNPEEILNFVGGN